MPARHVREEKGAGGVGTAGEEVTQALSLAGRPQALKIEACCGCCPLLLHKCD